MPATAGLKTKVLVLFVISYIVSCAHAIRVPVVWDDDKSSETSETSETFTPVTLQQSIPKEYFEYKAHKPPFAVDVAAFHGVKDPEQHYKSYPIRPYTGKGKPELGKHHMLDENRDIYRPYQQYVHSDDEWQSDVTPTTSSYEIFHPYKAEEPALQELYKDPVLDKIRNDLIKSKNSMQKYENEAGEPDIQDGEYLESPEETDRKKVPQRNVPAAFEIHRPLRRPVYYRPPPKPFTHEQRLNQKFRHPWNQNFVKVRPLHYRPLKNHLHNLRQHHALKYDDEQNEYPQIPPSENYAEPPEGFDIYLKGQAKYNQLRNNLDESINKAVLKNRPAKYQKLELQNQDSNEETDENEFVPIKNYAQVRKTETVKHLPRSAALADAVSYDDIVNAHRLREAVKSTKAQTVYTEEGYEDAAYDHAGEQKHASDHEGHGGFLREKEISGGKFKTPSFSGKYEDASGSVYREKKLHGKQWADDNKDKEQQTDSDDYSEDDHEHYEEEDAYGNVPDDDVRHKREHDTKTIGGNENTGKTPQNTDEKETSGENSKNSPDYDEVRQKRENNSENTTGTQTNTSDHDLNKREANFEVPDIDFNSTFLTEDELNKMAKLKLPKGKKSNLKDKYPYYFKNLKNVSKHSPLRYAENLKLMPLKSQGGTEFYDSRANIVCSEVDDDIDPIPEKIKNNGTQTATGDEDGETKKSEKNKFDKLEKKQRLGGLGDKIDCFKAKYFGENPLDSPFFKEQLIANPEPIKTPKLPAFDINNFKKLSFDNFKGDNLKAPSDFVALRAELNNGTSNLQDSLAKATEELKSYLLFPQKIALSNNSQQSDIYSDILDNIKNNFHPFTKDIISTTVKANIINNSNITLPKGNETILPIATRKKRATPFVYEPYKIIREGQAQESKKTTTTGNISPLIKQLQSSKVVEKVLGLNHDKDQPVKRNVKSRTYKDIGRKDRKKNENRDDGSFIDVNVDQRRGEPRYELKPTNHKAQYTPVDHKKAMTLEDYEAQTNTTFTPSTYKKAHTSLESAASKTVRRVVSTTVPPKIVTKENSKSTIREESGEDYDDYEDEEEDITTTTTTVKPAFRRRRPVTTTAKPHDHDDNDETEDGDNSRKREKLRLVTRFNKPQTDETPEEVLKKYKPSNKNEDDDVNIPKYREKKKKTRKSTLVTDTKRYGDTDDDDMRKDEVDALIGVKQNMDEYTPNYEKEADNMMEMIKKQVPESSEEEDSEESHENDDENDDDDEEDDDDEDNDDDDDEDEEYDEDENEHVEEHTEKPKLENKSETIVQTTPEPTKRTLVRTTEAPPSTTEARSAKLEIKPVVHRKQVEIHSELPANLSSPHVTQFKQDIKEVEIIKEMPQRRRKPLKNIEALNLFKDEKLAEEINKLKDVEIFRENLDLKQGPKHGGNYRSAEIKSESLESSTPIIAIIMKKRPTKQSVDSKSQREEWSADEDIQAKNVQPARRIKARRNKKPNDNEASNAKHIELSELDQPLSLHGGNLKSIQGKQKSRENNRNAKLIELDEDYENDNNSGDMHGGNFKYDNSRSRGGLHGGNYKSAKLTEDEKPHEGGRHGGNYRSAKLIEDEKLHDGGRHGGNYRSAKLIEDEKSHEGGRHGGNYRSAKLIEDEKPHDDEEKDKETLEARSQNVKGSRHNAAVILNGFAKAVPILTTTPNYIVDPSKRMYYYVDT